jgi:hypothetical protein
MGVRVLTPVLTALLLLLPAGSGADDGSPDSVHVRFSGGPPLPTTVEDGDLEQMSVLPALEDSLVSELQQEVLDWYLEHGYPFASVGCYLSSPDTLVLSVVAGRHASLERVDFTGLDTTRPIVLRRLLTLKDGDLYRPEPVTSWIAEISRLPFVAGVGSTRLSLGPRGNLVMTQDVLEAPAGYFSASLGVSSSSSGAPWDGAGILDVVNLFGTGRELGLMVERVDWGGVNASGRYVEPWIAGLPISAEISAMQEAPESAWVSREAELHLIWDMPGSSFRTWTGAGLWRGYLPDAADERWDYGLAGSEYDSRVRVPQGMQGLRAQVEGRAGSGRSGSGDSAGVFAMVSLEAGYSWFDGFVGLSMDSQVGGIVEGDWLEGRLERIGGQESLRGYPKGAFRVGGYAILHHEVSLGETGTRVYGFCDLGWLEQEQGENWLFRSGAGAGIRSPLAPVYIDLAVGIPLREGLEAARIYLSARTAIL